MNNRYFFTDLNWKIDRFRGIRWLFFIAIFLNILCPDFTTGASGAIGKGFDVVLLVDDSASMGTKSSSGERSDKVGRRIEATNILKSLFYRVSESARKNQDQIDFRFSIIRFGSSAELVRDWQRIYSAKATTAPAYSRIPAKNLVWTDFENAFEMAGLQFEKIRFGITPGSIKRTPVILLLTDGEPSTAVHPKGLGENPGFWKGLENNYINKIRNKNNNLKLFVVVFHNPAVVEGQLWEKNKRRWNRLGAQVTIISKDESNAKLYEKLEKIVVSLYFIPISGPDKHGSFDVPCFQEKLYFHTYFYHGRVKVALLSPSGKVHSFPYRKGNNTFIKGEIKNPEAGTWKIKNYNGEEYAFRFQPLPFQINYIYPPKNGIILPIPKKIKAVMTREKGEFTDKELKLCNVTGNVEIDEDNDDKADQYLKAILNTSKKDIKVETEKSYAPPKGKSTVNISIVLRSNKLVMLRTPWLRCKLSSDTHVCLYIGNTKAKFNGNDGIVRVRLCLKDFMETNKRYKVKDVFKNPNDSVQVTVSCSKVGSCVQIKKNGSTTKAVPVVLKVVDEYTLGADIKLRKLKHGKENWLTGYWRRLTGKGDKIDVNWQSTPNAALKDKVFLIKPQE